MVITTMSMSNTEKPEGRKTEDIIKETLESGGVETRGDLEGGIESKREFGSLFSLASQAVEFWLNGEREESIVKVAEFMARREIQALIEDVVSECVDWIVGRVRRSEARYRPKIAVRKILAVRGKYPILALARRVARAICDSEGCNYFEERGVAFAAAKAVHASISRKPATLHARVIDVDEARMILLQGARRWGFGTDYVGDNYTRFVTTIMLFISILCYYLVEVSQDFWESTTREAIKRSVKELGWELPEDVAKKIAEEFGLGPEVALQ